MTPFHSPGMLPIKHNFFLPYKLVASLPLHSMKHMWSDYHFYEDFQYKESIELFDEPLTLTPLLGHEGRQGIIHIN